MQLQTPYLSVPPSRCSPHCMTATCSTDTHTDHRLAQVLSRDVELVALDDYWKQRLDHHQRTVDIRSWNCADMDPCAWFAEVHWIDGSGGRRALSLWRVLLRETKCHVLSQPGRSARNARARANGQHSTCPLTWFERSRRRQADLLWRLLFRVLPRQVVECVVAAAGGVPVRLFIIMIIVITTTVGVMGRRNSLRCTKRNFFSMEALMA